MGVSWNGGTPKSSIFNRLFHYKPYILGYPYFRKHPDRDFVDCQIYTKTRGDLMESLDTTELQSKLLDFTRTVQTCVILLVLYDLRKLSFNKNCPKNGWCSSNTPQKTNSLNCPAFMYSLDPAGRIWDCLKDMFPEASTVVEGLKLAPCGMVNFSEGYAVAPEKIHWKIRPLIFFSKREVLDLDLDR